MAARKQSHGSTTPLSDPEAKAFGDGVLAGVKKLPAILRRPLTSKDRLRLPKIRRSAERVVELAIDWAGRNPRYMPLGESYPELKTAQSQLTDLRINLQKVRSAAVQIEDSIRKLETDLWMVAMTIYAMLQSQERVDESGHGVLERIRGAMKLGPRTQSHLMVPVEGMPRSKREIKRRQLAAAKKAAGLPPDPSSTS